MRDIRFEAVVTVKGRFGSYDKDTVTFVPAEQFYSSIAEVHIIHETLHRTLEKVVGCWASICLDNLTPTLLLSNVWFNLNVEEQKWWRGKK